MAGLTLAPITLDAMWTAKKQLGTCRPQLLCSITLGNGSKSSKIAFLYSILHIAEALLIPSCMAAAALNLDMQVAEVIEAIAPELKSRLELVVEDDSFTQEQVIDGETAKEGNNSSKRVHFHIVWFRFLAGVSHAHAWEKNLLMFMDKGDFCPCAHSTAGTPSLCRVSS